MAVPAHPQQDKVMGCLQLYKAAASERWWRLPSKVKNYGGYMGIVARVDRCGNDFVDRIVIDHCLVTDLDVAAMAMHL